jgi:hypothetical protein
MPLTLDGRWDKPFWADVRATTPFVRHDGWFAAQATVAKLCWDDTFLYLAYRCVDDDIWGTYRQRDDPIYNEDVVEAFIDPAGTGRRYFELEVSPHNVVFDCVNVNTGDSAATVDYDPAWDCDFRSAVQVRGTLDDLSVRDEEWTVEIAVPWTGLEREGPPLVGEWWRLNLYRIDHDRRGERGSDEYQCWSPTLTAEPDYNVPSRFGIVAFEEW